MVLWMSRPGEALLGGLSGGAEHEGDGGPVVWCCLARITAACNCCPRRGGGGASASRAIGRRLTVVEMEKVRADLGGIAEILPKAQPAM